MIIKSVAKVNYVDSYVLFKTRTTKYVNSQSCVAVDNSFMMDIVLITISTFKLTWIVNILTTLTMCTITWGMFKFPSTLLVIFAAENPEACRFSINQLQKCSPPKQFLFSVKFGPQLTLYQILPSPTSKLVAKCVRMSRRQVHLKMLMVITYHICTEFLLLTDFI